MNPQERIASAFEALSDQPFARRDDDSNRARLQADLDAQNEAARARRQDREGDEGDREAQLQFASDLFFTDLSRSFVTSIVNFDFDMIGYICPGRNTAGRNGPGIIHIG